MNPFILSHIPEHEVIPGMWGRFLHSERATQVYWRIDKDAELPEHQHPHEQIVNMLSGQFELVVNGMAHRLSEGTVFVIPPHAVHSGKALTECMILDVFTPVRDDYKYE